MRKIFSFSSLSLLEREAINSFTLFFFSFFLCAYSQPAWAGLLGLTASCMGYAIFWKSLQDFSSKGARFFIAFIWFSSVQAVQFSWMTSFHYQGPAIFFVYFFLIFAMGAQFGLLSLLIPIKSPFSSFQILVVACSWTLIEWSRLFVVSGCSWNPVGLGLTFDPIPMQLLSVIGIFGLSFWVVLTNGWAYRFLFLERSKKSGYIWVFLAFFPYLFGIAHIGVQKKGFSNPPSLEALLVQTALLPEQKEPIQDKYHYFLSPLYQWRRLLLFIKERVGEKTDLIVLPEVALPHSAFRYLYPYELMKQVWIEEMGEEGISALPFVEPPLGIKEKGRLKVANSYWAQALSNYYKAGVVIGLDDYDREKNEYYNAAFYFSPERKEPSRYIKRVLVPVGEYIPYRWVASFAKLLGVMDSFTPGSRAEVFSGPVPFGVSICYEETYGDLIRENRRKGAQLLVNITNDVWFPSSRLPKQHFDHGKIRAVENGVPVIRSCNTGVTGAVDCFGRTVGIFSSKGVSIEELAGAFPVSLSLAHYPTLYSFWGDGLIVGFSSLVLIGFFRKKKWL